MGKTSKYFGVSLNKTRVHGRPVERWQCHVTISHGKQWITNKETERDAALAVDKKLIELGRQPVNILKPKNIEK